MTIHFSKDVSQIRCNGSEECDLRNKLVTDFEGSEYSYVAISCGAI